MLIKNLLFLFLLTFSLTTFAQNEPFRHHKVPDKIAQLEKIKLIETLEMNEETTLRFFSRRTESQKKVDELENEIDLKLDELNNLLKSDKNVDEEKFKSIIDEINNLRKQVSTEKDNFVNSLTDILTYRQIAKLIVFERNFREELRDAIFRDRKMKKMRPPENMQ